MMKPILFNTEMVKAILDGRKRYTRRICKGDKPPFERGDILWVRETWNFLPCITCQEEAECREFAPDPPMKMITADGETEGCFLYRADGEEPLAWGGLKWRPAIHMPKAAARIWFRVAHIRKEKLQDGILGVFSPASMIRREGADIGRGCERCILRHVIPCCIDGEERCPELRVPIENFVKLWNSTVPKDKLDVWGWEANPEVWTFRFERCDREGRTREWSDSLWASPLCEL